MKVWELFDLVERDYTLNDRTSLEACRHHFRPVIERFGDMDAEELTTAQVERYQADRIAKGAARQTVNNELSYLRRGFKLALRLEKVSRAPQILNLRVNNARMGFIKREDYQRMVAALEALAPVVAEIVRWLYLIGWRSQEVKALTWDECDHDGGTVQLPPRRSKNRSPRRIKLPPELHASLRRRWLQQKGPFVFHRHGKQVKDFRSVWDRVRKLIGRPKIVPHDCRRSWARNALLAGVPARLIMEIGGWKTRSMLDRYCVTDEQQIEEALTQVCDFVAAKPKSEGLTLLSSP